MSLTPIFQSLLLAVFAATSAQAAERAPWTTSHVHGSPEKPLPYRVERVFPKVTFKEPLEMRARSYLNSNCGVCHRPHGGTTEKIPAAQIAKTTTERVSMMPEGLLQSLTAVEAADLLEFLGSLK